MTETRYARSGDAYLAYRIVGAGDVDILVGSHGTISIDAFDREPHVARFMDRLATFARVIQYDRRGIGLSDPYSGPPTIEIESADAVAVLDAVDSQSAAIFTTNYFAPAGIFFGAQYPDRTTALILFNATARLERADDYPWGIPKHVLERFFVDVIDPLTSNDAVSVVATHSPSLADDDAFVRWWEGEGRRGAGPQFATALAHMNFDADVRALLPMISVPTLVLHTRENRWNRLGNGQYLADHIPGAKFVELGGGDHLPFGSASRQALDAIEEFLTGAVRHREPDRTLKTVLFTDIVSSTQTTAEIGDRSWREVLDRHDAMIRRQIERFDGREIKTTGDGFLTTFDGPALAIKAAVAMRNGAEQLGVLVRIGIHTGEVELRGHDVTGIAVNIGQRVSALAEPGEVLVSRTVTDLVAGSGLEFDDRGERELKGVPGRWQLYSVKS